VNFDDFTEKNYKRLLRLAKSNWRFIDITQYKDTGNLCFWRHDVDFSLHRAYRLALLEAEEGVKSTYFIHLHSRFYNPLEDACSQLVLRIINLGHSIGLHFDFNFYTDLPLKNESIFSLMTKERDLLTSIFAVKIDGVSLHNPSLITSPDWQQDELCGMINTYGSYFRDSFFYCSDSHGYWRHESLEDVLKKQIGRKIHILIHPGWWTRRPMPPSDRVMRCIEGRAKSVYQKYRLNLESMGRRNVWDGKDIIEGK
jgi:hypothetical protein